MATEATEQTQTPKWEVTVYGLGTVHAGGNHKRARKAFDRAVYQSRHGTGPERGQVVTMWLTARLTEAWAAGPTICWPSSSSSGTSGWRTRMR